MRTPQGLRPLWLSGLAIVIIAGAFFTINYVDARSLPADRAAVESQLDRKVYGYITVDGTGWVATRFVDKVIFDHLILDPKPMGIPPEPRWQWSGDWTSMPVTDDSASARTASADGTRVVFGQINDPAIVSMEIETTGTDIAAEVTAPGYLVSLERAPGDVQQVRFLNETGDVVYEMGL